MIWRVALCSAAVLAVLVGRATVASGAIRYDVTPLGDGRAVAINDASEVVGTYTYHGFANRTHSWYWNADDGRSLLPIRQSLPDGYHDHKVYDINDRGVCVGQRVTYAGSNVSYRGFAFDLRADDYLNGSNFALYAINDHNVAVGDSHYRTTPGGAMLMHAVRQDVVSGAAEIVNGSNSSTARGINRNGVVGGAYSTGYSSIWAFINDGANHALSPLVTDGRSWVHDLSDGLPFSGMIVGRSQYPGTTYHHYEACWWDAGHNCHSIGRLGGDDSEALACNNVDQVVGTSDVPGGTGAFIYHKNGTIRDLSSLTTDGTVLTHATGINIKGQIVGYGPNGACLLDPVYFADGDFQFNDLGSNWTVSGGGTAAVIETGPQEYAVELTAGSPVTLSQPVDTPAAPFDLSFDVQFLDDDLGCELTVTLDGTLLDTLWPPAPLPGAMVSHSLRVGEQSLLGLDGALLELTYDGPAGSRVMLDNVTITQAPEPATLSLLALSGLAAFRRRRRQACTCCHRQH